MGIGTAVCQRGTCFASDGVFNGMLHVVNAAIASSQDDSGQDHLAQLFLLPSTIADMHAHAWIQVHC